MLTKNNSEQWFHQHLHPWMMAVEFNAHNEDECACFVRWTPTTAGREVFALRGSKSVV